MSKKYYEPDHSKTSMPRWFNASREASLAFVEKFCSASRPTSLFHYTSTSALISIVRNNELWLSDATFLNDKAEIEHGRNLACTRLDSAICVEKSAEVKMMLELVVAKFKSRPDPNVYVACFSMDGDDLTQWRGYGQGGGSIAIEFEYGPLMFGYYSEGMLQQVIYNTDDQIWIFDMVILEYSKAYENDILDPRPVVRKEPMSQEDEREICAGKMYYNLWSYIAACKHQAFQSEREVRFTYTAHDYSLDKGDWYPQHPDPMFRESVGRIIPYLSSKGLNFKNMNSNEEAPKLPIRTIRIGPTEDPELIKRGIKHLLNANNYEAVEITTSGSPFRPR